MGPQRLATSQPPGISCSQEANKLSSNKATDQSEVLFDSPGDHSVGYTWPSGAPGSPSGTPRPLHLRYAVPADAWVVAKYCINHNITLIKAADIKDLLKLKYDKPVYDAIHWLLRHHVLKRDRKKGYYNCNLEYAFYVTHLPPYPIGKRHYANLEAKLQVPEWQEAQQALCEWLMEIQGTGDSCIYNIRPALGGASHPSGPQQTGFSEPVGYPRPASGITVLRLRTPSGYCLPAVATHYLDGTPMYIFLQGLLRPSASYPRQDLYCARQAGALYCFARPSLLRRYMSQPCPFCPPAVPHPKPCEGEVPPAAEPVLDNLRVNGDQQEGLVPYSQAPDRFSYGEPGVHYSPRQDSYAFLGDLVTYVKHGAVEVEPKARAVLWLWQSLRHPDTWLTALIDHLTTALSKSAEFGRSFLGLSTPQLMAKSKELVERVLRYRHGKGTASRLMPYLRDVTIDVFEKVAVPAKGTVAKERYQWVKRGTLTFKRLTLLELYHLLELHSSEGYYLLPEHFVLVLPLFEFQGLSYIRQIYHSLKAMYVKVYHNPVKDRPGTLRLEGVPLKRTVKKLDKRELFTLYFAQLQGLGFLLSQGKDKLVELWLQGLAKALERHRAHN